jgi:hypothetical protein
MAGQVRKSSIDTVKSAENDADKYSHSVMQTEILEEENEEESCEEEDIENNKKKFCSESEMESKTNLQSSFQSKASCDLFKQPQVCFILVLTFKL